MHPLQTLIDQHLPAARKLRQHLHQHPELKFDEFKTAATIEQCLGAMGIEHITRCAQTGVVAIIEGGKPGSTIALRADIDALPIQECTQLSYQSQHADIMHACGHDGHTAALLLTAQVLQQLREHIPGKVKLIFQPAEEGGKGSSLMIADGVLDHPTVDAIYGWHIWPGLPLGAVATRSGTILAGNGRFEISIQGKSAHLSMPTHAINPVSIGAEIIRAIEQLRPQYQAHYAVINMIRFACSEARSGTCDSASLTGVYFVENDLVLARIKSDIEMLLNNIAQETGAVININYFPFHQPTINTAKESRLVLETARQIFPADHVIELSSVLIASEDFSAYLEKIPGCFFMIGAGENSAAVHTDQFDFPDEVLRIAAYQLCTLVLRQHSS